MEGRLFEDLVVSRGGGRRAGAVGMPFSMVLHAAGLTGLLALSLVVPEDLPAPPSAPIGEVVFAAGPRAPVPARPEQPMTRSSRAGRHADAPALEAQVDVPSIEPDPSLNDEEADAGCIGCAPLDGAPGGGGGRDGSDSDGPGGIEATGTGTGPVRAGGQIQPPRKIRHVDPTYPDLARRAGIAGVVILECVIDREGLIRSVQVVGGHPLLNEAAVSAVRRWTYRPTRLNGIAVEIVMTVTVRFSPR